MLGSVIVLIMFIWAVTLSLGVVLGKLFWSPPGQ